MDFRLPKKDDTKAWNALKMMLQDKDSEYKKEAYMKEMYTYNSEGLF